MKDISGKYGLIVLHPSHFLMGGAPVVIKHPVTKEFTEFFVQDNPGFLRQGSPTGPRLPAFSSRGDVDRDIPLNPILVNFAAMIWLRRLVRQNPRWGSGLDTEAINILRAAVALHNAIIWNPRSHPSVSVEAPIPVEVPDSDQVYDLSDRPFTPNQSGNSDARSGTQPTFVPVMTSDEFLDLMEQGGFLLCLLSHEFSNQLCSSSSRFSGPP